MGCWNETCGMSQLPIIHGDPVALFLLLDVSRHREEQYPDYHSGHCYPNDVWSPLGLPIFGVYDDYGSIEDIVEDWSSNFLLDYLKKNSVPGPNKKQRSHPENSELTIETLLSAISDDQIFVKNFMGQIRPVGFMMMHRNFYDLFGDQCDYLKPGNRSMLIQDGLLAFEAMRGQKRLHDSSFTTGFPRSLNWENKLVRYMGDSGARIDAVGTRPGILGYKELLWDIAERGGTEDEALPIIEALSKHIVFHFNFEQLRKSYAPQAGKGSQDNDFDLHMKMLNAAIMEIKEIKKRHHYNDFEDLDEAEG